MSDRLPEVWNEVRHGPDRGFAREAVARSLGFCRCRRLRSAIDRRHPRDLRVARHQAARAIRPACHSGHSAQLYLLEMVGKTNRFGVGTAGHRRGLFPPRLLWTKITAARTTGNQDWTRR